MSSLPENAEASAIFHQYSPFPQCDSDQLVVATLPGKQSVVSHHPEPFGQPAHIELNYKTTVLHNCFPGFPGFPAPVWQQASD